jgi:hypothetical protein
MNPKILNTQLIAWADSHWRTIQHDVIERGPLDKGDCLRRARPLGQARATDQEQYEDADDRGWRRHCLRNLTPRIQAASASRLVVPGSEVQMKTSAIRNGEYFCHKPWFVPL